MRACFYVLALSVWPTCIYLQNTRWSEEWDANARIQRGDLLEHETFPALDPVHEFSRAAPSADERDAHGHVIPAGCHAWFDGCNTCTAMEAGFHSCTRKLCPDDLGAAKCLDETGQQTALFATAGKPAPKAAPKQPQCTDAMGCTDNGCNCQNGGHCDQTHCRNVKQVACNQGGCNQAGVSAKDSVYCSGGCNQKGATALSGIVLCSRHNWGDTCLY